MHYVVGDVHGCFKEMMDLIRVIEGQDSEARFLFLGDFIDRGPQVWETVQWVVNNITPNGRYQSVRGNHEELIIQWYDKEWLPWWKNGGSESNISMPRTRYDFSKVATESKCLTPERLSPIVDFIRTLPFQKDINIQLKNKKTIVYHIAHAWVTEDENISLEEQRYCNLWLRNYEGSMESEDNAIIVHGHTPTISEKYYMVDDTAPGLIGYRKNAINLDGGCTYGREVPCFPCMLCAICLETLQEYYPYTIEERFRQINKDKTETEIEKDIAGYTEKYLSKVSHHRADMLRKLRAI